MTEKKKNVEKVAFEDGKTVKAEAPKEAVKATAKTQTKTSTPKTAAKATEVKDAKVETKAAEKVEVKASSVKKVAEKKAAPAKKAPAKKTTTVSKEIKKELHVEFQGKTVNDAELYKKVIDDCKAKNIVVTDVKLYVKPEDEACYYVANGSIAGQVALY